MPIKNDIVVIRGGGDIATGVIQKFFRAGTKVLILETKKPTAIRLTVSLCTAVINDTANVEDMIASLISDVSECENIWKQGKIPIIVDEYAECIKKLKPNGVIDAILAKKNCGTNIDMADVVIALGPGFSAPDDADAVIETMRGHNLGRVILEGEAIPNTGIPGIVEGRGLERVLRAPCDGILKQICKIGDIVKAGTPIFEVNGKFVDAPFDGLLRGLLEENSNVFSGMKCADIDPRKDSDCYSISDKARSIGGGALEAYLYLRR